MSENPATVLEIVDADTMTPIERIETASGRTFSPIFNGPGTYSCAIRLDSRQAKLIHNRATGLLFTRNGRYVWSGGMTSVIKSAKANSMQITATGWLEEFDHRFVRKDEELDLAFSAIPGGEVIQTLVNTANAQQDTDLVTRPLRMSFGTFADTQVRTTSFRAGDNYGQSIQSMVTIEDGCDLAIDHLNRRLSTLPPTSFTNRTGLKFGYGIIPNNLDDVVETSDGTVIFNRENVVTANGTIVSADDGNAIDTAGVMLEEWTSLSDVNDITIAEAFANAELVYKKLGLVTYQVTPKQFGNMPRPYDDFEWGDVGYLSVDRGAFQLRDQAIRLFAGTLTYDNNGNETVSELQLASSTS